jgi:hypothetical protein
MGEEMPSPLGSGEQHTIDSLTGHPVVFMFQPTEYEVVTGDRLQEWQKLLAERVGLQVRDVREETLTATAMAACISFCPAMDDCDQVQL